MLAMFTLSSCVDKQSDITPTPQPPAPVTSVTDGPQGESTEKIETDAPTNVGVVFETSTAEMSASGNVPSSIR